MAQKYSQAHQLGVRSVKWCAFVESRLFDGYGVEDIALWLECHVNHVRNYVKVLRRGGVFRARWGRNPRHRYPTPQRAKIGVSVDPKRTATTDWR